MKIKTKYILLIISTLLMYLHTFMVMAVTAPRILLAYKEHIDPTPPSTLPFSIHLWNGLFSFPYLPVAIALSFISFEYFYKKASKAKIRNVSMITTITFFTILFLFMQMSTILPLDKVLNYIQK